MIDKNVIIQKAQDYDVITFDVFDTLIIRDVMIPTDIFTLAYGKLGRYIRVISELWARKCSKNGEVTLEEIEHHCPFSCKKELEIEERYCRANPAMLEIYNELKNSGKKIYAISDMYLSSEFLTTLLNKCGYDIPVIVSCEEGCNKISGELFNVFLNRYSLPSASVLHIGDNKDADGNGAGIAGVESLIIEKHKNMLSYMRYSKKSPELSAFINHGLNEISDPVERIGYEVVGPIILAFCHWIHDKSEEYGFDCLFFLARDMRFAFEIYNFLYPNDKSKYLCVSRKSLAYAKDHSDDFCNYLRNEGCFGNVAIVDVGWVGGMQLNIEKYSKMINSNTDLGGLYLGSKLAFRKLNRSIRSGVFLYSTIWEEFKAQLFPPFMETLIGCNEKQVISYMGGNPVFSEDRAFDETKMIKLGAEKYIKNWSKSKNNISVPSPYVRKTFERMFYWPLSEHVELLGKLQYEDFKTNSIVSFDANCSYWKKPGRFMSDLSKSAWKGAFLSGFSFTYPILLFIYFVFGSFRLYFQDVNAIRHNKINSNPKSI